MFRSRGYRIHGLAQTRRLCLAHLSVEDTRALDHSNFCTSYRYYSAEADGSSSEAFQRGKKILDEAKQMVEGGDETAPTKALSLYRLVLRLGLEDVVSSCRLVVAVQKAHRLLQLALTQTPNNPEVLLALARLNMEQDAPGLSSRNGLLLMKRAADLGLPEAQYQSACLLREANGATDLHSIEYLRKAAAQGHAGALFLLGVALYAGTGVEQNIPEATSCFSKAAQEGYLPALTVRGAILAKGTQWNIPTNEETDNDEEGSFFLDNEDRENAREHFELAAQAGDAIAEAWLERERRAETHNS